MANRSKLLMTPEIGMTNLGKYTLPNIPELETKVLEVLDRQEEK